MLSWFRIEHADRGNSTIVNANVRNPIQGTGWVDNPASAKKQTAAHRHLHTEKNRLAVQLGPGDGAAAEHFVISCATKSLVTGVGQSIGSPGAIVKKIPALHYGPVAVHPKPGASRLPSHLASHRLCHNAVGQDGEGLAERNTNR